MKIYSITKLLLPGAISMAWVLFFATSCTAVDYAVGDNLLPGGQDMNTGIDSSFRVETSLFKLDSINASNYSPQTISVGSYVDPLVGRVSSQVFTEFSTVSFVDNKGKVNTSYFGKNPTCDSIFLFLDVVGAKGDTMVDRQFQIYRVNHRFYRTQHYYSNFLMPASFLYPEPLVTFKARKADYIKIPLPGAFASELLETTEDPAQSPYYRDSLFHKKFNGLYFKSDFEASAAEPGNMINIDMYSSKIQLYYRNSDTPDKDTSYYATYTFQKNKGVNASIEMVQHDFSLSDQSKGGVNPAQIGDSTIQTKYCYAQGMAGLGTIVKFSDEQIRDFKQRLFTKWPGYSTIAIHRAVLRFNVVTQDWMNYNKSYTRLGLYYDIARNEFIPDYDAQAEEDPFVPVSNLFDGYLKRSLGYYEMDITSYFQLLVRSGEGVHQQSLQMLPSYSNNLLIQRSQMYGSDATGAGLAPQMVVTYTMLR